MNEEYKRENHKSYLVLKMADLSEEADYGVRMMCENPLDGFLPMSIQVFNGEKELCYDISSKQPFQLLYEKRRLQKEDLEKLFADLQKALHTLDAYLLETEPLILDPAYIYVSGCGGTLSFLYAPVQKADFEETVYDFAEYILEKIDNEDEVAVMYGYSFYRYIKEEKGDLSVALEKLLSGPKKEEVSSYVDVDYAEELSERVEIENENRITESDEEKTPYFRVMRTSFFAVLGLCGLGMMIYSVWKHRLTFSTLFSQAESIVGAGICTVAVGGLLLFGLLDCLAKKADENEADELNIKKSMDCYEDIFPVEDKAAFSETSATVHSEEDYATVLLQENCYTEQRILVGRVKGRKRQIDLSSFPFVVGKSKEQVDYTLEDSSVSRVHARFTLREDVVYLTDLNSTNGTRRNGILLEPNELVMLEADDEIAFGRLTFTYH